jgi:GcrA cell cycle regulator
MSWTEERVEQLKTLWAAGLSASQIAAELGGVTRNAVIGKVHRIGLPGRARRYAPGGPRERTRKSPQHDRAERLQRLRHAASHRSTEADAPQFETEALPEFDDSQIPAEQRCTLFQLTDCTCRYGVGDPREPGFFFCGGTTFAGLPWCPCHALRVIETAARPAKTWHGQWRGRHI